MKRILSAAVLTGLILTSCDSNSSKKEDYTVMDSTILPTGPVTGIDTQKQATPVTTSQPIQLNQQQQAVPVSASTVNPATLNAKTVNTVPVVTQTQPTTAATATAPGMNPPHGQPGHRCDISVGAPLNSNPNQQPVIQQPVVTQQPTQQPATTVTAPGMNPPHGQPNHRCDIAVGAPLNSAPPAPVVKKDTTSNN